MPDEISPAGLAMAEGAAAIGQGLGGDDDYRSETNGELRLLEALLPFCQTVFDVGACGGEWTEAALEIKPELTVHCFEPQETCQQALVGRIGGRAILNCFAVGRTSGQATIYSTDEDLQVTSTYRIPHLESVAMRQNTISILTLADYCAQYNVPHIDFLKIDVEGAEMDVLEGGIELFRQGLIMAAQFEYGATWHGSGRHLRDVFDLMAGTEYVIAKLLPEGCQLVERYHPALDSFRYSNWLLLQREIAEVIAG